jgi:hypothetical protein
MQGTASTSNYYDLALHDDREVENDPALLPLSEGMAMTARQKRIAAAVVRSKSEYQSHHAYTERRVSLVRVDMCES